ELRTGARTYRHDGTGESVVRKTVDIERRLLPDAQIGDVRLFRIGVDPRRLVVNDTEHRAAGRNKATKLDVVHLRGGARHGRSHDRVIQVALRVVESGLGLSVLGKLFEGQVGIAEQLGQRGVTLLYGELSLQLRSDYRRQGSVEIGLRS